MRNTVRLLALLLLSIAPSTTNGFVTRASILTPSATNNAIKQQQRRAKSSSSSLLRASPAVPSSENIKKHQSSISGSVFNLIKANLGAGVLALPYGLAAMSDVPQAVIPACIFLVAIGGVSAYTFNLLGPISEETNADSLGEMWQKLVGPSSWVVDAVIFTMTMGICISYSMLLGDFTSDFLQQVVGRNVCIVALTAGCLYPLALLPSLKALAPVSLVGVAGMGVTCAVMAWQLLRGQVGHNAASSFGVVGTSSNPLSALVLGSMAATSYLCHFSAADFFKMVDTRKDDYKRLAVYGFGGTALINCIMLSIGFLTFGGNCASYILNNYASNNGLANVCRLLMILSVIGSYPFMVGGARASVCSLLASSKALCKKRLGGRSKSAVYRFMYNDDVNKTDDNDNSVKPSSRSISNDNEASLEMISPRLKKVITTTLVVSAMIPSLLFRNAGLVISFNGATMGSCIAYIFPAIMAMKSKHHGTPKSRRINTLVLIWGIVAVVAGGAVSIMSEFAPHLLR